MIKPTNPAAQKAALSNQHKVSPRPMSKIRPKPVQGNINGKVCVRQALICNAVWNISRDSEANASDF